MTIKEAVVAVTYDCNLRCSMCNIWRSTDHTVLSPSEYKGLPRTLRTINITGGEPFLRDDLLEVIKVIHSVVPHARLVISSNGYMTDIIAEQMSSIRAVCPDVGIGISLDGTRTTHDHIRGVAGSFDRAMETVRTLISLGFSDLRFGMTITPENIREVESVYLLAKSLGIQFTATYAHNSEVYFGKSDNPSFDCCATGDASIRQVIQHLLSTWSVKDWLRAYHFGGMLDSSMRQFYYGRCEAGRRYIFVAPDGNVYPCNVLDLKLGNIRDSPTWDDAVSEKIRCETIKAVRLCQRDCWMVCNTRSLITAHPLRVFQWIVRTKLRLILHRGE